VLKLIKDAWTVSFGHTKTNRKAVLSRGWGPRTLNYYVFLYPEILSFRPKNVEQSMNKNLARSSIPALDLNLSEGMAGMLFDCIVTKKNKGP
jgi:hypothetical protein